MFFFKFRKASRNPISEALLYTILVWLQITKFCLQFYFLHWLFSKVLLLFKRFEIAYGPVEHWLSVAHVVSDRVERRPSHVPSRVHHLY